MKKTLRRLLAAAAAAYLVWLGFMAVTFRTYSSEAMGTAGKGGVYEIQGVYHVHTSLSDGHGSPETVIRAAAAAGLDFLIPADHGNPNIASLALRGRRNGVLVLPGSELNVSRGHLAAIGFEPPARPFSARAEDAVAEIEAAGGIPIIAHPYSKVGWSWGDHAYAGLEIMNGDSLFRSNLPRLLPALPLLLVRPRAALLRLVGREDSAMDQWDRQAASRRVFGYFSIDAHMLYRASFDLLRLHVLLDAPPAGDFETAATQIHDALRRGRFYNAVEGAAEARGFRFTVEAAGRTYGMGDSVPLEGGGDPPAASGMPPSARAANEPATAGGLRPDPAPGRVDPASPVILRISAPFDFAVELRLFKDGREIARGAGPELQYGVVDPGAYRAEAYLRERSPLRRDVPWIVANPIFVGREDRP